MDSHKNNANITQDQTPDNEKQEQELTQQSHQEQASISPTAAYFKLWSFASPIDIFLRCIAAFAAAGSGTAEPLMAFIFGKLVNIFNGDPPVSPEKFRAEINKNALYFLYLFIGKFALVYLAATLLNFTSARMTDRIRMRYLSKLLHRPISYFDKNNPGSISSSLANDTNTIQVGLAEKLGIICQASSMILCAFIVAFTKGWKLTLVTATVIPYMMLSTGFFGGRSAAVEANVNELLSQASAITEEALSSISMITAMGARRKIVDRYDAQIQKAMKAFKLVGPLQACIYGNMFFSVHSAYAIALFYGVKLVNSGEITDGGSIVTVLFCVILSSGAMGLLAPLIPDFTKAAASAHQIMKVLEDSEGQHSTAEKKIMEEFEGSLNFNEVTFAYPERPSVNVINNVTLHVPRGQITAIVGQSGSGKSTIVGLLEKWSDPQKGSITADGQDLQTLDITWWRSQIGLVQQEPTLFNDSILNNVLYGLQGPDSSGIPLDRKRGLVIEACKNANAHEFIMKLPQGYDTLVGERACLLSGGQRQRIAIARSIISDAKLLILDEATSSLDTESERAVLVALDRICKDKTVIMISHKLSTIQNADNIVVMSKGIIAEQGTHSELLAMGGQYCRLLQAQGKFSDRNTKDASSEEDVSLSLAMRALTHESKGESATATPVKQLSLELPEVSRKYGILHCMCKMYRGKTRLVLVSIPAYIAALITASSFPLQALFFSRLVTIFATRGPEMVDRGNFWALMFFILALACLISWLMLFTLTGLVGATLGKSGRHSYLDSILSQDLDFFQAGTHTSGGLSALLAADGVDFTMLFASNAGLIIVFSTTLVACCVLSIAVYWKLGLVAVFGCIPALLAAGFLRMRLDLTAQDRCAATFLECARYTTEAIAAIRTVSSLNMEGSIENSFNKKLNSANSSALQETMLSMILYALSDALVLAASGLVFWYGGRLTSFGELSSVQFFLIFGAVIFGGQSAGFMFGFTTSVNRSHAAMNRIIHLKQTKPCINSSTGQDPTDDVAQTDNVLEFRNVDFRYPSRSTVPVLRGLSLSVPRGSHVCVVGPSGSGKSTIVALTERFYDVEGINDGHSEHDHGVFLYERPISDWDAASLRKTMGLVSQDTTLYHGTIRDNILLGVDESHSASTDDIETKLREACRQANLLELIESLPEGFNTDIGSRGVALSGGQRQRLALARCFIRKPRLLLLDEFTSSLDSENSKAVREALAKTRQENRALTVISVTHQVEGMQDADNIFVVDCGKVVEEGSWSDLMSKKGRLWSMIVQGQIQ